jgi:hypothetical protein
LIKKFSVSYYGKGVHYLAHKSSLLNPNPNQFNPVHILTLLYFYVPPLRTSIQKPFMQFQLCWSCINMQLLIFWERKVFSISVHTAIDLQFVFSLKPHFKATFYDTRQFDSVPQRRSPSYECYFGAEFSCLCRFIFKLRAVTSFTSSELQSKRQTHSTV